MDPRKIALITPSVRLLGARRSLLALAKNLDPKRFTPIVVCPRTGDLEQVCRAAGLSTHVHALPPWRKGKYWPVIPFHVWRLRRWARDLDIRLIHCNEIYPTPYAIRVGRRLAAPTVSHMRLSVTERLMRNYDLHKADRVITVSHAASDPFRVWPDYHERVRVIYNGLDIEEWCRAAGDVGEARKTVREQLGLPGDAFLIGHIGLISRRKQQHLVVEAARRISPDGRNWHILIVGDPSPNERDYAEQVAAAIESAGLSRRITIWPFRREIEPVFAALDLNLLISSDEGFGRVAIEAGALGIPTIGTRIGGIPEVVVEQKTGLLVDVDDVDAVVRAIERFGRDADFRQRLGAAARDRVKQEFTIQVHANKVMDLYDEVLAGPGTASPVL